MDMFTKEKQTTNLSATLLTQTQKDNYQRDGFLVIPDFVKSDICEFLTKQAKELIAAFNPEQIKIIFSTKDTRHSKNLYFLESGDKIRFFFEENAINDNGELISAKEFCINKIGHALHDLDPVFNCFSRQYKIAILLNDLGVVNPLLVQSMFICKQPYIGGEVACHQDSSYLHVKEGHVLGLWFALEDATIENGCLWAIPGAHHGSLRSRMVRDKNDRIMTEIYDNAPWPMEKLVPLEASRGSLILLHGLLPHLSKENISTRSRNAYSLHVMSSRQEYLASNWLRRPKEMPFKGFLG